MENNNENIINDTPKVRKPLTEAQKQVKKRSYENILFKNEIKP